MLLRLLLDFEICIKVLLIFLVIQALYLQLMEMFLIKRHIDIFDAIIRITIHYL